MGAIAARAAAVRPLASGVITIADRLAQCYSAVAAIPVIAITPCNKTVRLCFLDRWRMMLWALSVAVAAWHVDRGRENS